MGVDEAGRGPVLGPMLYGIAYAPLSKKDLLVELGCADSKTLTEKERDEIFDKICDKHEDIGWIVEAISPNVIANSMYRRSKCSLNEVSKNSAVGMIKMALEAGVNVHEVYVDTVGKPEKYQEYLKQIFPEITKIVVAKKADSTYPIVSAASICAKVSRDHALKAWIFREDGIDGEYGSGYPNDPATKKWLTDNIDNVFGFPQLVRFSWSTAEVILKKHALAVEWEDEEDENVPKKQKKMTNFFSPTNSAGKIVKQKHEFFKNSCLVTTTDL